MKLTVAFLFLTAPCVIADCVLPGLQRFAAQNGLAPECGMVGTSGFITLHGDTRFSWSRLRVGPGEDMTTLQINGNHASVHVVRGPVFVAGALNSQGAVAVFGSQVTVLPTGSISGPEVVVSGVLPVRDEDVDGYFSNAPASLEVQTAPGTALPGNVTNSGTVEATVGNLTVLGGRIDNTAGGLLAARQGVVKTVSAERIRSSKTQSAALSGRPAVGNNTQNFGAIEGFRVEMRAVPPVCPDEDCTFVVSFPITNQGRIAGTANSRGVVFDVSGGSEDSLSGTAVIENRLVPGSPGETGTIVTPDFLPLLANDPAYVKGGLLQTTRRQIMPDDGDNPSVTPSRFQSQTSTGAPAVPLLPSTSAAGVVLRTQPAKPAPLTASSGTRGSTSAAAPQSEDPKKRKKPVVVRGAFFGVPIQGR